MNAILLLINIILVIIFHSAECILHNKRGILREEATEAFRNETYKRILEGMDLSVDPCEDFHLYSCNGWIKTNPIPDGKTSWCPRDKLKQENQLVLKKLLEQPYENFKSLAEIKAKMFYESCLDINGTTEELGAEPLLKLLKKIGGWNITDSGFNIKTWSLQRIIQIIQNRYGIDVLFSYYVSEDIKNSTRLVIIIDQTGLALPSPSDYSHEPYLEAYLKYMTEIGVLLGGEYSSTKQQAQAVLDFEKHLANITIPEELRVDTESLYHLMTIKELQEIAEFIDWKFFFEDAFRLTDKKITDQENIVVYAPEYLKKLTLLIKEYTWTEEKRIILNSYIVWQIVQYYIATLSSDFFTAINEFQGAYLILDDIEVPRWSVCLDETSDYLKFAVGSIFIREIFDEESKKKIQKMINNIRNSFKQNLKRLKWMDNKTRAAAIIKADAMVDLIGYPEFIKNSMELDKIYDGLIIQSDNYFENIVNINKYLAKTNLRRITEPPNRSHWYKEFPIVNAYSNLKRNGIIFPAGIFQKPFFDLKNPPSLNYGSIGMWIGHELIHNNDYKGREYDKDGTLNNWWSEKVTQRFKSRTNCFVDQYNQYKVNGQYVNGSRTLREIIADNGGLRIAYHAYIELMKNRAEAQKFPGLGLNHRQLFFIAFAQIWCFSTTASFEMGYALHPPDSVRLIGALSNLDGFNKAFKCKPGSKMNPTKKCKIF